MSNLLSKFDIVIVKLVPELKDVPETTKTEVI